MKKMYGVSDYFWITITWLITTILLRGVEWLMIANSKIIDNSNISELKGIGFDVMTVLAISAIYILPYLLLRRLSIKFANITTIMVSTLFLSLHFCFLIYFQYELKPVNIFIFGYSYNELLFTIQTSGVRIWWAFAFAIIVALFLTGLFCILRKVNIAKYIRSMFITTIMLGLVGNVVVNKIVSNNIDIESEYFMMINKSQFFYERFFEYIFEKKSINNTTKAQMSKLFPNKILISDQYPLLSPTDFNDVIGDYFDVTNEKPNIVIIISEGLASKFIGNYNGAVFMPYLTELSKNSLYWTNCLSTGERSHVAAPSILSSTPYGKIGFAREYNSPYHFSFVNLLHDYYSSFYYGQGAWFDNKESFLKCNGIDRIVDKDTYPSNYRPIMADDFFWGYDDKDLFTNSLNRINENDKLPRLDIYFTGTMHPPFSITDETYYNQKLDSISNHFSKKEKEFVEKYRQYLLTLMYTDDAYRNLMEEYAKRNDFKNTIFVITGDHPVTQLPIENTLERFHVPLYIYSPMLNTNRTFHSVNSHFDILPTFVAFLKNKYNMDMPTHNAFIGKVIDTATKMRCLSPVVFMNPNGECVDMFYKNMFIANNRDLYTVNQDFSITKTNNEPLFRELSALLPIFSDMRLSVCKDNKIIPDSLFFKVTKPHMISNNINGDKINISASTQYFNIMDKTLIQSNVKYFIEFGGEVSNANKDIDLPSIIVEVKDINGNSLYWNSYDIGKDLPLRVNLEIKSNDNPTMSIYMWNKNNAKLTIDNPICRIYTPR